MANNMVLLRMLSSRTTTTILTTTHNTNKNTLHQKRRLESLLLLHQHRCSRHSSFSTAATAEATTASTPKQLPQIISRRAYQHHLTTNPRLAPPSSSSSTSSSTPTEEKPWPLPLRIGFYIFTALVIPYTAGSMIASSQSLRDYLEGDRPDDDQDCAYGKAVVEFVREYWGEGEDGPYVERIPLHNSSVFRKEGGEEVRCKLEGEESSLTRLEQKEISVLNHSKAKVRIMLEGGVGGICAERIMDGTTLVNMDTLKNVVVSTTDNEDLNVDGGSNTEDGVGVGVQRAAIDFSNTFVDDGEMEEDNAVEVMQEENSLLSSSSSSSLMEEASQTLRQMTPIYSTWNHFPSESSSSTSSTATPSTNTSSSTKTSTPSSSASASTQDIRIAELEWNIKQLMLDLKDPNCTRDIDDMELELRESKKELRRLKGWFRW